MPKKIDFYAILGVTREASESEIEASYDHLMQQLESAGHGLDATRLGQRINLLNQAYWALSDKARRARYDASSASPGVPLQFSVEIREPRWTSPRAILNIVGRLIVMGLLIQVGFMLVNFYIARQANNDPTPSEKADILKGYDAINGKLSPEERATGEELAEKHRQEAAAEQITREQEEARRRQEWELEKDRRYADEVSSNLHDAEAQQRQKAEEERRRLVELEREKQEQERDRIDRLREKWRAGSTNNNTQTGNGNEE
jgi:curved DNA-binding protein CbpA